MRHLSRRHLLAATPLAGLAILAGCTAQQVAQGVTDVGLINTALQAEGPSLTSLGVSAAVQAQASTYLAALSAAAASIAASGVLTAPSVQSVVSAVNGFVGVLGTVTTLPPNVTTILTAAEVLLPIIGAAVGLSLAAKATKGPTLTPDQARLILASAKKT